MPGKSRRLLAAVVAIVGIAGCAGKGNVDTSVSSSMPGLTDVKNAVTFFKAGDRQTASQVAGTTLQGSKLDLASYRGKWVVVNFWYSTCGPCEGEATGFEELSKQLAPQVQFVGIDERDSNVAQALNFERAYRVTYPSLYDRSSQFTLSFPGAVPPTTPFTVVLDPHGGIAAKCTSSLDYTSLRAFVKQAKSEPT